MNKMRRPFLFSRLFKRQPSATTVVAEASNAFGPVHFPVTDLGKG
jgi:hypothetical protein